MVNFRIVSKIIGSLLFIEGGLMLFCLLTSIFYKQEDAFAFAISMILVLCFGFIFKYFGRNADNNLGRRDAYLVVTSTWIVFTVFGMMPFLISGYLTSVTDAFFETMSGFTTTGASIIDNVDSFPHGLLLWRSLTHWIGGLGIVFFTIAILPSLVGGSVKVFAAESTGPLQSKLHPRLTTTAKLIWIVYILITVSCSVSLWLAGMGFFDAINYAMSISSTGGFATHTDSVRYFHSASIEYISIIFQLLAGINFVLLYLTIFKFKIRSFFKNSEIRFYLFIVSVSSLLITYLLIVVNGYSIEDAFRKALFQVVSFSTSTGLYSDNTGAWSHITWIILAFCMFFGACAGSTTGGFKCIRGVMIGKLCRNEFKRILHPKAVLPLKIDGHVIAQPSINTLFAFFSLYISIAFISAVIFVLYGMEHIDAITAALSCIGNTGPFLGSEFSNVSSWSSCPDGVKWIASFLMLTGRLEIMSVLVLFTPVFWKKI